MGRAPRHHEGPARAPVRQLLRDQLVEPEQPVRDRARDRPQRTPPRAERALHARRRRPPGQQQVHPRHHYGVLELPGGRDGPLDRRRHVPLQRRARRQVRDGGDELEDEEGSAHPAAPRERRERGPHVGSPSRVPTTATPAPGRMPARTSSGQRTTASG